MAADDAMDSGAIPALPEGLPASVAYDLALTEYASNVPPRQEVPSEREQRQGVEYEFKPAPPPPKLDRPTLRTRAAASVRKLDPRGIAGEEPVLPLIVLGLLNTVGQFDNTAFIFLLVYIQADLGLDLTFLVKLMTVLEVFAVITSPAAGYLADRMSRVWMVRIGSVLDNAASILTGFATGVPSLVGSRIIGGLGPTIAGPALPAIVADYYPVDRRARVFGFQAMVGTLWTIISFGFLLYAFRSLEWSWRSILIASGVASTGVSFLTFLVKDPVRGKWDRIAMGASEEAAEHEQKPVSWSEAWRATAAIGTMRKLWYATPFLTISGRAAGIFMFLALQSRMAEANAQAQGGIAAFMADPANTQYMLIFLLVVPGVINLFLLPYATSLADRLLQYRPGRILYYAGILQVVTAVLTMSVVVLPVKYVFLGFFANFAASALMSLILPARTTLMSLVVPARVRAQALQTIAPWHIAGLLGFLLITDLVTVYGPTRAMLTVTVLMVIGSLILTSSGANVERDIRSALAAALADEEARAAKLKGQNKMIVARDIDVHYDGTQVLFHVDFDVDEGEIVALLGTNGAGKSTLLRAISGIQEASAGAIFLDGIDITHKPAHLNARDGVVFLPGGRAVFPTLTVAENLRAAAWLYSDDEEYVSTKTDEIYELFPILRERRNDQAGNLSGGEQQMLGLGQAFLMKPRLLMIDELSLGLAPAVVDQLLETVRAINATGTTVILVEQSVNVALTIAQRAVFMDKGQIRFDGPTAELLARSDLVRAVFLGGSTTGFVALGLDQKSAQQGPPETVLAVRDLSLSYGGVRALTDVSLSVEAGEIVGIIGPNGAGKTSLFDVISGYSAPSAGEVEISGVLTTGLSPDARARLGLARSFQDTRLFPSLTVRESIAVALEQRLAVRSPLQAAVWSPAARRSEQRAFRRVDNLIDLLGLGRFADKFINELSTGSRRIVDLACVMAAEPKILLLDEPSSGVAQAEIEVLGPVIERLAREANCGVLVIEHDMPLIRAMSDRLVAMELGTVVTSGMPDEVLADPHVLSSYLSASKETLNRSGDVFNSALDALGLTPADLPSAAGHPQGAQP